MIVKCEQCQTRFKIPDEKVTDKGVKVRCTKCSHTFRVRRGADGNAEVVPPAAAANGASSPQVPAVAPAAAMPRIAAVPPIGSHPQVISVPRSSGPLAAPPMPPPAPPRPSSPSLAPMAAPSPFLAPPPPAKKPAGASGSLPQMASMPAPEAALQIPSNPFDFEPPPPTPAPAPASPAPVSSALGDDLFGDVASLSGPASGAHPAAGPDRSMFDIPPPSDPPPSEEAPAPTSGLELASPAAHPSPMLAPVKPVGKPEDAAGLAEPVQVGAARRVTGLVVNVAVATVLVLMLVTGGSVYLNEGKLDWGALSPARIASLLVAPSAASLVDVSNGLYETKSGRSVFFVRGSVLNRSNGPLRAKVKAELLDGNELVRAAEALAGATPTPEDVFSIESASDAELLLERIGKEAQTISAGSRAPFFVLFNFESDRSPDLSKYRLRVTVSDAGAGGAKASGRR